MTRISFDEPSKATVNSNSPGLEVVNQSSGQFTISRGIGLKGSGDQGVVGVGVTGVTGTSITGTGVHGESSFGRGVTGHSQQTDGIQGLSDNGTGVFGEGPTHGVHGKSGQGAGVYGQNTEGGDGVTGNSGNGTGVAGISSRGTGVYGRSDSDFGKAGYFQGDVTVTGDICLGNADCAEDFDVVDAADATPGTVMVLHSSGAVRASENAYDTTVVGVVSGAGGLRPGIILDRESPSPERRPLALMGKVYCKVDASYAPIAVGDLLVSSPTHGHAMTVRDRAAAFGSVIGKALGDLASGTGVIPILVGLR
ncbi:MAG: hypothetical protein JF888_01360 [Candidatus Dormibacteraeota bacterium]|uniref:Uncharacterized protein n=1 Tax=Candidatus Dormiibacter inghamiae TaxID=3127013 RepID=A0A934KFW9_9BACT|nr:hypothetical protein [Candidatus Dormibacteraeota bacterium]MBJ7605576.1 hypothetical protein [Candidatus Dormibacteraeota bacterium]